MDDIPSPASSRQGGGTRESTPRNGPLRKNHRHAADDDGDAAGDTIECTGKACQSCTAGIIADCVAICCCPCAVVDILAFTFLKVPYMMGRKWLRKRKKKKKMKIQSLEKKRKCERSDHGEIRVVDGGDLISRKGSLELGPLEIVPMEGFEEDEEVKDNNFSARFEAEEVWLELYRIGHLGFGRVSFTGMPPSSQGKANNSWE